MGGMHRGCLIGGGGLNGLFVVYTVEWERGYRQGGLVVRRLVRAKGRGGGGRMKEER